MAILRTTVLGGLLLCQLLGAPLQAAQSLPDIGDVSSQTLSPQQEREIGQAAMVEIRRSGAMIDDPEVVAYLNQVGYRLVDAADAGDTRYTFFGLRDKSVNAFAMPGGYIGVHSGLIVMSQHESELASVLAHEIAHVSQRHVARLLDGTRSGVWMSLASLGLAILAAQAGRGDLGGAALAVGMGMNVQKQLDYTYAFEQEADRIGMQTLQAAGYDPASMPAFFERLQKHNRAVESNAPEFLRTHPVTYRRIADAQSRLDDKPFRAVPDSADFLFLREKLRAQQLGNRNAVEFFQKTLADKRYASEAAARYGLAYAYYQAHDYEQAAAALQKARSVFGGKSHPALEYLGGQILQGQGRNTEAVALLKAAAAQFVGSRALTYGTIDALTAAGQLPAAQALVDDSLSLYPGDAWLYLRAARVYGLQDKRMQKHKAMGEYYVRLQEYAPALEQFQLALQQPGDDFYLLSAIEARIRDLESMRKN
ncbi:M48 family metalloprotease [Chitinilyticum piscinae]|uniref:M48 family metallopeptidase n=1 Tax=Chitinilyticum piscinae TaxID=2866724 RepID=A0A8J7FIV5_9NEIS|nr:M48 family metalloprotease [Chitinilyticum piscinae]MBE9610158.1 M48 family metallopeptidase [Chitinilyticum piscinae]